MKLTTAIIVFASTIANANGKRGIRRALVSEQDSYYSMSMPTALDADAMKGGTSGKSGKEPPVGAVEVVSDADDGPGSLRVALQTVTTGTLTVLIDKSIKKIDILSTLEYGGTAPLEIVGLGDMPKIVAEDDFDVLATTACTDLSIKNVAFEGSGDFSIENQGDGRGIFVDVPIDATGDVSVALEDVMVSDTAWHGVFVNDCTEEQECGNGNTAAGEGSDASVVLNLKRVTVENSGKGKYDGDGVRVNERGIGSITATIEDSKFNNNGADGVELDEAGEGDVTVDVQNSEFNKNGDYCFISECEDNVKSEDCLAAATALDPSCVEDRDPGTPPSGGDPGTPPSGGELDLDDGFDIDEADGGNLVVTIIDSEASDNLDQGFDFEGTGLLTVLIQDTEVSGSKKADLKVEQAEIITSIGTLEIIGGKISAAGVSTKNMDLN